MPEKPARNSGFFRHQEPVRIRRRGPVFAGRLHAFRSAFSGAARTAAASRKRRAPRKKGFSFPVPSPATLAVAAGTLLVSLLALNWEGFRQVPELSFRLPTAGQNFTFQPGPDPEGQRNLASYALASHAGQPFSAAPEENSAPDAGETESGDIPLDLVETFKWTTYQVQKGDSVSRIASRFAVSMDAVIASNNIHNARRLREGETLKIPNIDGIPYTVKKGDSLDKIAKSMGVPLEAVLDANDIRSDAIQQGEILFIPGARMSPEALKLALGELLTYPVRSRVTSQFGWRISPVTGQRHFHAAVDFAGSTGTPVKSVMDGAVSTVGVSPTFGKYIILRHDSGYQSMYAHLSAIQVKQGERVNQGVKIGEVGSTGLSTGPHLHFALYKNGRAVNPLDLLN